MKIPIWDQKMFVCKWAYESILHNYVKRNIEKCVRLIME